MFTIEPTQIAGVAVAAILYAIFISWPPIRSMDDDPEWRWLITSGGVAIVVLIATVRGPVTMLDLFVCFGLAAVPIWVRAAMFRAAERRVRAITEAHHGAARQIQEAS